MVVVALPEVVVVWLANVDSKVVIAGKPAPVLVYSIERPLFANRYLVVLPHSVTSFLRSVVLLGVYDHLGRNAHASQSFARIFWALNCIVCSPI